MANFLTKLFGSKSQRDLKEVKPFLDATLAAYPAISQLDNDGLRAKTIEFKERIRTAIEAEESELATLRQRIEKEYDMPVDEKEHIYKRIDELEKQSYDKTQQVLDDILPEAYSVVKETAKRFATNDVVTVTATDHDRDLAAKNKSVIIDGDKAHYLNHWMAGGNEITWDMVHYDVQIIGGVVLHKGKIAEMATGEGKTLVATLPVYLNALPGKGVHVVTVNDYLAKRDSEWMGMLFEFHGLTVDCIDKHEPHSDERKRAYNADITYGTNNEFGFDYLRDNMSRNPGELVQRGHNYAIVDEVDSVLIDDARTPLIISGPTGKDDDEQEFYRFKPVIEKLYNAQRLLVTQVLADAKKGIAANPDPKPEDECAKQLLRAYRGLPKTGALIKYLSETGIRSILQKTENFYMQEQNKYMHIIDDELYFVIDEKNRQVELTDKGMDYLTSLGEDPNFYQLPDIGSAIAEVEQDASLTPEQKAEAKDKIYSDFAVQSERVHTVDQLLKAYTLFVRDVDYILTEDNQVKIVDEQTGRIMEGRRWSDGLHQAVEAKENAKVEAATQTYATITLQNYFRMYKKLAGMTGTAETEAGEFWNIYKLDVVVIPTNKPIARVDMDDMVYKTKKEKYAAVIAEIKRLVDEGRPVLVGTTSVETSELLSKMLRMQRPPIAHNVLNAKLHQKEADIVAQAGEPGRVTIATNMAGRGTDIKLKGDVREKGGLAIIGTERHESRRVDRQLRGRAGRQGDPGSSLFFVSLEDDLMRLFGSERIASIMDKMGLQEGEVIQHSMITKAVERSQKKVEENNFGIRKRLLEYDDVMNNQRTVIYNKRRNALYGDRLSIDISNMFYDTCELLYTEGHDWDEFQLEVIKVFAHEVPMSEKEFLSLHRKDAIQLLYDQCFNAYHERMQRICEQAWPFIKNIAENTRYINVAFPITDGKKTLNTVVPVQKAYETHGRELQLSIEKGITLAIIDDLWKEHLRQIDDLRQSVQNAAYEQKDPLVVYKFESFKLFESMLLQINREITSFLSRAQLPLPDENKVREARVPQSDQRGMRAGRDNSFDRTARQQQQAIDSSRQQPQKVMPVHVEKKVGRNDPCPCGSGKKYKNCHGQLANED